MEAVGLMFTDVRDKLFLGELVKRRMPNVQLFTYGGHLLYARPERRDWLNGMLVFSTYPLVPDNQWWLRPDIAQSRMAFPTDGAEGTYNATLLLLQRSGQMLDYGGPIDIDSVSRDSVFRRPPVWVSVVGAGGMFRSGRIATGLVPTLPQCRFSPHDSLCHHPEVSFVGIRDCGRRTPADPVCYLIDTAVP